MLLGGCLGSNSSGSAAGVIAETHSWFPITTGTSHAIGLPITEGTIACASCHASTATSLKDFTCVGCHGHEQTVTDLLHLSVPQYAYASVQCLSCHPSGQKVAYDHANVTNNCATCHDVGTQFAALPVAGFQHEPTGGADCGGCHTTAAWTGATGAPPDGVSDPKADLVLTALIPTYVGMAISSMSPLTETLPMPMNHTSTEVRAAAFSACTNCHQDAATGVYYPGNLHSSLANLALVDPTIIEPTACASCHLKSMPVGFVGPTAANPARTPASGEMKHDAVVWANDASTAVSIVPANCGTCHASPSATVKASWATNLAGTSPAQFHPALSAAGLPQPTSCIDCHANSRPSGLTNSTMATSAATGSSTGIPAGTLAQISHADVNVSGHDCGFCHTQAGVSTTAGIQGKEWAQANFHANFTSSTNPLVVNGTTGRCSNCHMNVKPGAAFTAQDHSAFTNASGSTDCSSCHSFPGTGTVSAPNWLGIVAGGGVPATIPVGGFTISQPPATSATTQKGIANLPHPTVGTGVTCSTCHTGGAGGVGAIGYDHQSSLINSNCNSCHEAGSNLVGTKWNGATAQGSGAGDTRPYTIASLVVSKSGSHTVSNSYNHFYPVDCRECHSVPSGNGLTTTGSSYTNAWTFPHKESNMTNSSTCNMCHGSPNNVPK